MLWGRTTGLLHHRCANNWERSMAKPSNSTRPPVVLDYDSTVVVMIEMSLKSWLAAALVPGVERRPLQKLSPDPDTLLQLLERWRCEAIKAGKTVARVSVAYEAGRDGFWLARLRRLPAGACPAVGGSAP
jgi:transposase